MNIPAYYHKLLLLSKFSLTKSIKHVYYIQAQ
jgi:hypothetical protein